MYTDYIELQTGSSMKFDNDCGIFFESVTEHSLSSNKCFIIPVFGLIAAENCATCHNSSQADKLKMSVAVSMSFTVMV